MEFLLATQNKNKKEELSRILQPLGIQIKTAADLNLDLSDVAETGETFEENAYLKAASGCRESGLATIADDSGLCVDALCGRPGIYSARFAGEHGNDAKNISKLLHELKDVKKEDRTARFVCAACCVFPSGETITVRGECEGIIGYKPIGSKGFGYDPVFIVGDLSFAQLSAQEKDSISHRRKALEALYGELRRFI
ncbi:MAG: RdgB/HAM1 family non-canonical purine NTP pyrophosphatase [Oscillospiraceae bacterium]|nr:RdgB/HAM1 family non-canonical purine NTP pyrophosphatase [Oscillospiraceae bacterium]